MALQPAALRIESGLSRSFTAFTLPRKPDGTYYADDEDDCKAYLNRRVDRPDADRRLIGDISLTNLPRRRS